MSPSNFQIDIKTRVVSDDDDVFIIQPGEGFWLYETFRRFNVVFLDFPDLQLDFENGPPGEERFREMIVRSMAINEWLNDDKKSAPPSRDLRDYVGKADRRRLGRYVGAARRLYFDVPVGTMIAVPGPNYHDDVLIGEIVGKPRHQNFRGVYDGETVPVRKVEWHRGKPRGSFSLEVRKKFGTTNPIIQLERSLRGELLWAGFDQYAYNGLVAARLNTTEQAFNTLDDYNIQTFVNYVAGILVALDTGVSDRELSLHEAIAFLRAHPDSAPNLTQNINSKGFQRLASDTFAPIVIGVLLSAAIAQSSADAAKPTARPTIEIVNTAAPKGDSCKLHVEKRVQGAMKLMKLDEWERLCEAARDANLSTGLSTSMQVKAATRRRR